MYEIQVRHSYTLDDLGALVVKLIGVAGVRLLLAILQAGTRVGLKHAVFRAEMPVAEAAVADDALSGFLALLEIAARLADGHCEVAMGARREGCG